MERGGRCTRQGDHSQRHGHGEVSGAGTPGEDPLASCTRRLSRGRAKSLSEILKISLNFCGGKPALSYPLRAKLQTSLHIHSPLGS